MGHRHFNLESREVLARLLGNGFSQRKAAEALGVTPSAVCQELKRNTIKGQGYLPEKAQRKCYLRRLRANRNKAKLAPELIRYIQEKLENYWSPEQIAGRLKIEFPHSRQMHVSFKTIYTYVCPDKSHARTELSPYRKYLRHKWKMRRSFRHGRSKAAQEVNRSLRIY